MAKKVRTPPPPRRVQTPQKRDTRRAAGVSTRPSWLWPAVGAGAAAVVAAIVIGVVVAGNSGSSAATTANVASYNHLPGIRRTKAPWPPDYQFLADRLAPLGLQTLPQEAVNTHYHSHLDIYANGKHVTVPALIGINTGAQYITQLHTHDTRGVIHIESPKAHDHFTLGQLMAEWGVFLNSKCVGGYCNGLKWYLNGKRQTSNPQTHTLQPHDEIAIVVGKPPARIPSTYKFLPGE